MALPSFCKQIVVRVRPGSKTVRGTPVPDWDQADRTRISGCSLQELTTGSADGVRRTNAVVVGARLYAPLGSDIRDGDRIEFDGQTWDVDGHPLPKHSPTGAVSHLAVVLTTHRG